MEWTKKNTQGKEESVNGTDYRRVHSWAPTYKEVEGQELGVFDA